MLGSVLTIGLLALATLKANGELAPAEASMPLYVAIDDGSDDRVLFVPVRQSDETLCPLGGAPKMLSKGQTTVTLDRLSRER